MNYEIKTTDLFERELKRLSKKYASMSDDYAELLQELIKNPKTGNDLGSNFRKVRMAIASKSKGKRGGARVITYTLYIDTENSRIYLLTIYDKDEQANISKKTILSLKKANGL